MSNAHTFMLCASASGQLEILNEGKNEKTIGDSSNFWTPLNIIL
jgi:hypothetical protein